MQAQEAVVGKLYMAPKTKVPLQIVELQRANGEGPVTKVIAKSLASGNNLEFAPDYEVGDESSAEEVKKVLDEVKASRAAAAAEKAEKNTPAKKEKAKKEKPVKEAAPAEAGAAQPEAKASTEEKEPMKLKKGQKNGKEFRGRPADGVKSWSSVIDSCLLGGKHTKAQIVDKVMRDEELKVPKAKIDGVKTLVSVRMARAKKAGAKVTTDDKTKVLRVIALASNPNPWRKAAKEKPAKKEKKEKVAA